MHYNFPTVTTPQLYVEIGAGSVDVQTADLAETTIEVTGDQAEDIVVERRGDAIVVVAPRRVGFFGGQSKVDVTITAPFGSDLVTRLGSADLRARGELGHVKLATGSGEVNLEDVTAEAVIKSGSGDVSVGSIGRTASVKSGSGDISVRSVSGHGRFSTGSGDIAIAHAEQDVVLKSGSGDLELGTAPAMSVLSTASGDVRVGRCDAGQVTVSNVSGDIRVGIAPGVPIWTDVSSTTGRIKSTLVGAGQPAEGQDHIEVRAKSVSGSIYLEQLP